MSCVPSMPCWSRRPRRRTWTTSGVDQDGVIARGAAAKEGGFLGIGGERVSEREQPMLETLGEIFGVPRGSPQGS